MNSLGEIVAFTGVTSTAGVRVGLPVRRPGLRDSGGMVSVLDDDQKHSMRALVAALPALPPITLSARVTNGAEGAPPLTPTIHVDPSAGAVVETVIQFFFVGRLLSPPQPHPLLDGFEIVGSDYADMAFDQPGNYGGIVTRVGVTSTGLTKLTASVHFTAKTAPPPTPPPTPTPTAGPTCGVEIDGNDPGSSATANVRVFGGGFAGNAPLVVLEDGSFATTTVANALGGYSVIVGVLRSHPPVSHRFQTVQGSTIKSNEAGITI